MHKVFDQTNIITHSDHPITVVACHLPSTTGSERGQGERLQVLENSTFGMDPFIVKTNDSLTFNTVQTVYIQACVKIVMCS